MPVERSEPGVAGFRDYARNDEVEDPTLCGEVEDPTLCGEVENPTLCSEHRDVTLRALALP